MTYNKDILFLVKHSKLIKENEKTKWKIVLRKLLLTTVIYYELVMLFLITDKL